MESLNAERLLGQVFDDSPDAAKRVVLRLKAPAQASPSPKVKQQSWVEYATQLEEQDKHPIKSSAAPHVTKWDRTVLTSVNPLESSLDYGLCTNCQRPMLKCALPYHVAECKSQPQATEKTAVLKRKAREDTVAETDSPASSIPDDPPPTKKAATAAARKVSKTKANKLSSAAAAEDDSDSSTVQPRVAKKRERKKKTTGAANKAGSGTTKKGANAAVDVERQCGVLLPDGTLCARSLTCKSHSMGAKRLVPGRSAPYDVLLANYQRRSQVKAAAAANASAAAADDESEEASSGSQNPDEIVAAVMAGVANVRVFPLERKVVLPTRLRTELFRMREMLASALIPKGTGAASMGGLFSRANVFAPDQPQNLHFVRPPMVQRAAAAALAMRQKQLALQQQAQQTQQIHQPGHQAQHFDQAGGAGSTPTKPSSPFQNKQPPQR